MQIIFTQKMTFLLANMKGDNETSCVITLRLFY